MEVIYSALIFEYLYFDDISALQDQSGDRLILS